MFFNRINEKFIENQHSRSKCPQNHSCELCLLNFQTAYLKLQLLDTFPDHHSKSDWRISTVRYRSANQVQIADTYCLLLRSHSDTVNGDYRSVCQFQLHTSSINTKFTRQDFYYLSSIDFWCGSSPARLLFCSISLCTAAPAWSRTAPSSLQRFYSPARHRQSVCTLSDTESQRRIVCFWDRYYMW